MFLSFEHLKMMYEPFPIGLAKPALEEDVYAEMVDNFPPTEVFDDYAYMGKPGAKLTLSEKENPKALKDFIDSRPIWSEFYKWLKSDQFVYGVMDTLKEHHIDLGFKYTPPGKRFMRRLKDLRKGRLSPRDKLLKARFEFSALRADGGHLNPHTDAPTKISTIIVSMTKDGEWDPAFGGGTDVNRPKEDRLKYNYLNDLAEFEDMEIVKTFEFSPNQAIIFVKTYNSWHSVRPIQGDGTDVLRKTLTINIEPVE